METIPLFNIERQNARLHEKLTAAADRVLTNGVYISGEENRLLEERIASYCSSTYAVAVNSGTDALILSLDVAGVKPGDEVITTPYTFFATAEAIKRLGATPVFVDIDPGSYNIDPALIEEAITERTKAIVPVHLFGLPANMETINKIAERYHLAVIEDACQAIGAKHKGKPAGSWGDLACLSFYPTKNFGACGDGGMILTNHQVFAEKLKMIRTHGTYKKYHHSYIGYNTRLDEMQAAFLSEKLSYLSDWNDRRRTIAKAYSEAFSRLPVQLPREEEDERHVYHLYILKTKRAEELEEYLKDHGIGCGIYYPLPLHRQKALIGKCQYHRLSVSEETAGTTLAIPIYPELTEEEQDQVIRRVLHFFG